MEASDRAGLERLLRYAGRPALSQRRLSRTATGQVRYRLRKPYYTGQTEVVLEPEAFVRRLAALVPPARQNQVRYYGLLASQARDRERLLAQVPGAERDEVAEGEVASAEGVDGDGAHAAEQGDPRARAGYRMRWARLLARVFGHEVLTCPSCGGRRSIIAALTEREAVVKVLAHLGLPTEAPSAAPARAPPQLAWSDDAWPAA